RRTARIIRQIASALSRAHGLGIVHRDLKPENVMLVTRDGDEDFVKVLDFGIAKVPVGELTGEPKAPGQVLTQLGMVYGTPEYMAPEQALGQPVDATADLYGLGVILFEMIVGARPYDHESKVTLLGMHVTAPIPRMTDRAPDANVPEEVEAIVRKLLAKESTSRFADARALIEAIDAATDRLAAAGRIPEPAPPYSALQGSRGSSPRLADPLTPASSSIALGPTSLAQEPARAGAGSDVSNLIVRARSTLVEAARAAPAWATKRRVLVGASGIGALLVLVFVLLGGSRGGAEPANAPRASGSAPAPAPTPVDHRTDEAVGEAVGKIERGDYATAIDTLTTIEKKYPERADVHMLLERAYTGVRNTREAVREASLWLAADPGAVSDLKLQEDVRNAALLKEEQESAFSLLESKMGTRGIDILYDVAYGASGRMYPQAAARAKRSLAQEDVRGRASPALSILLDFTEAKGCETKHDLLDRARLQGDARLLAVLQKYQSTRGCGFLGVTDCYPCLHRDQSLRDAMTAIEERALK
ncbi:MAG TPA: protein kinase, partial [Polyangiaceae bacterium]|nr:protein kinase [Polyangiaceae bacterium]